MSKHTHTPGPWDLELNERGGFYVTVAPLGDMQLPATIASRSEWGHRAEESHANARLIASAPELLEALQGAKTVLELAAAGKDGKQHTYLESRLGHFVEVTSTLIAIEAAIARATGQESGNG